MTTPSSAQTYRMSATVLDAPDATALDAATARAVELAATVAEYQPLDDGRVQLGPAGHPFCLFVG